MKKIFAIAASAALCLGISANAADKEDIVKTGYSYGPLPAVSFDADKGFQYGALLQLYNYGDGSSYPMYKSKWYFEISAFTKGSNQFTVMYDKVELVPGIRFCAAAKYNIDTAYDFFGFNGYGSYYDADGSAYSKVNGIDIGGITITPDNKSAFSPFYKIKRNSLMTRADFIGEISPNLHWMAGYHLSFLRQGTIDFDNINKGKAEEKQYKYTKTLLDYYTEWGIIPEDQKNGGIYSCIRAGLEYDTRDKEGAPASGIWADAHINYAPKWLGSSVGSTRYSLTWRQYFPLISNNKLTLAYRLNYEGTIGDSCPYYLLPYVSVIGVDNDVDGMGGSKTCRGIMRGRITGLDTALYTVELRWRFLQFQAFNQNIALGLNLFSDGAMATRLMNTDFNYTGTDPFAALISKQVYDQFVTQEKDVPHITAGSGFRFIMNENFIVACDYGLALSQFYSNSHKGQDGTGALYIGLGYLF